MIFETVVVGVLGVNCYVLATEERRSAVIIDPGDEEDKILAVLERHRLTPGLVINTHGHGDHICCDDCFGVEVRIHKDDLPMLTDPKLNLSIVLGSFCRVRSRIQAVEDGEKICHGGFTFRVIHTPGHTRGGMCLLMEAPETGMLFSGDTLFRESVGRADLGGGDERQLLASIRKLYVLPPDTRVYPGHGPSSDIGHERECNPFIRGADDA